MKSIDIERLAERMSLSLEKNEAKELCKDLAEMLALCGPVLEGTPAPFEPLFALPCPTALREDTEKPSFSTDEALLNAPQKKDGMIRVPKTVE